MPMAGDKDKKGFSGLSDLASKVSGIDEPIKPEPKAEAKQPTLPQREAAPSKPKRKTINSPSPIEAVNPGKSGDGSGVKWILGIIGVIFVIWMVNSGSQSNNNKKPSYSSPSSPQSNKISSYSPPSSPQSYSYPQSAPNPAVQSPSTTQSAGLQYTKPSAGTWNVLSVPEIRWCIREDIRIKAMRNVIDNNAGIDEFNHIVNNYNIRCGSYRYREGSQSRAERDVEAYRSQISLGAIREARQLGSRPYSSVSSGASTSSALKKPNAEYTKEAQQLLTDLGYDPGPVDGDYGRRTAGAVKAFQRDAGITQDGWIDQDLLSVLRKIRNQQTSTSSRSFNLSPTQSARQSSEMLANASPNYTVGDGFVIIAINAQTTGVFPLLGNNSCLGLRSTLNGSLTLANDQDRKWHGHQGLGVSTS